MSRRKNNNSVVNQQFKTEKESSMQKPTRKPFIENFAFDTFAHVTHDERTITPERFRAMTYDEKRRTFSPPQNFATALIDPKSEHGLAMDAACDHTMTLIQHAMEWGQAPVLSAFVGYPALSGLAQDGIINAAVEVVANDMVREWIEFPDTDKDDSSSGRCEAIEAEIRRFKIRNLFHQAIIGTRFFGGGLVFIDTGVNDPETLRSPLNLTEQSGELGVGKLKGFKWVEPINITPGIYNSFYPLREDYLEPKYWWILGTEVHASRVIKFSSGGVPDILKPMYNFFGIPFAQTLWDYAIHFKKNRTSVSRMLEKYSDTVLQTNMEDIINSGAGANALENRLRYYVQNRSNDGIIAIDKESEGLMKIESTLAGLTDIPRQDLEFLCAIARTPATKLMGISPSGFNATGENDRKNYDDHIHTEQIHIMLRPLEKILKVLQLNIDGRIDELLVFDFKPLHEEDRQIESNIRKANTDGLTMLLGMGPDGLIGPEGAQAVIEANPDDYLPGLLEGIQVERERMEQAAEQEVDELGEGEEESDISGVIKAIVDNNMAQDDKWITVKPNGPEHTGRPMLIGEGGEIKAGAGGKFTGQNISNLKTENNQNTSKSEAKPTQPTNQNINKPEESKKTQSNDIEKRIADIEAKAQEASNKAQELGNKAQEAYKNGNKEEYQSLSSEAYKASVEAGKIQQEAEPLRREQRQNMLASVDVSKINEASKKVENTIRGKTVEHGVVIDLNGNVLARSKGDLGSVSLPKGVNLKDTTFTHNHPSGNSGFSGADIMIFARYNMREMRAVGKGGKDFSITRTGSETNGGLATVIEKVANDFSDKAFDVAYAKIGRDRRSTQDKRERTAIYEKEYNRLLGGWLKQNEAKYGYKYTESA